MGEGQGRGGFRELSGERIPVGPDRSYEITYQVMEREEWRARQRGRRDPANHLVFFDEPIMYVDGLFYSEHGFDRAWIAEVRAAASAGVAPIPHAMHM